MEENQIEHLRQIFTENRERKLLIDQATERAQTYNELLNSANAIAVSLNQYINQQTEYICVIGDNSLEMLNLFFAIWQRGCCVIPINPQLAPSHIAEIIESFDNLSILVATNYSKLVNDIKSKLNNKNKCSFFYFSILESQGIETDVVEVLNLGELLSQKGVESDEQDLFSNLDDHKAAMIIFTSGSTSKPKGVSISMPRLIHNERRFCSALGLNQNSRFVHMFPMSYLAGIHNLFLLPMSVGGSIVLINSLSGANLYKFWMLIEKYRVNTLWFTATMLSMLLKVDDGENLSWLEKQINIALVGMAPLPKSLKSQFERRFGIKLFENYALSETTFISTEVPGEISDDKSKGFLLEDVDVQIYDPSDRSKQFPKNKEGELFVKSPFLMLGYHNASDLDNNNLTEDGFFTGDLGYIKNDQVFITGRQKELIIRGGINISPAYVEARISELPDILEVAVVGIPHEVYGEEVVAAVVLHSAVKRTEERQNSLRQELKMLLPFFQRPKEILIVDSLKRGLTGKIDKNAAKNLFNHPV